MPSTPDRDPLQASFDKFTMPGDIPDARGDEEARGYATAHPAGRGWVPEPRHEAPPNEGAPGTVIYDGCEHSFPFGVPEDIAAACGESAVFTRERRVRFIDNLACKGNVRAAAALAGVSHETAYRARRQDAAATYGARIRGFAGCCDSSKAAARM